MVNKYTVTLALVAGVLALILIVVGALGTNTLAVVAFIALIVLPLIGVALLQAYQLTHGTRPQTRTRNDDQAQVIDGNWRELSNYQAPQAQLPTPRYLNVPRYASNGAARPLGAAPQPPLHLQTQTESGETLTVPYDKLLRFLSLATPTRAEWSGKHEGYSAAMEFCLTHGLLDKRSNGGVVWRSEYPIESRKAWALQFETQDARDG